MTQVIADPDTNRMFVYILNNKTSKVDIEINDLSIYQILFNFDAMVNYDRFLIIFRVLLLLIMMIVIKINLYIIIIKMHHIGLHHGDMLLPVNVSKSPEIAFPLILLKECVESGQPFVITFLRKMYDKLVGMVTRAGTSEANGKHLFESLHDQDAPIFVRNWVLARLDYDDETGESIWPLQKMVMIIILVYHLIIVHRMVDGNVLNQLKMIKMMKTKMMMMNQLIQIIKDDKCQHLV